jgi:poly(hydroxyalkanoate) granule-associated protein
MSTQKKVREKRNGDASEHSLAMVIRDSANQIWLAGLGAYARAEEEGSRLFDNLVNVGERVETRARDQVHRPIRAAERQAEKMRDSATGALGHLRHAFDRRLARMLNALQIPTSRDVEELTTRVEELTVALERMERRAAGRRAGTGGQPAARRSASGGGARKKKKTAATARSATGSRRRAGTRKPAAGAGRAGS